MVFTVVDKRNYPRIDVDREAELTQGGGSRTVRVRDLSAGGARLEAAPMAPGTPVTLQFEGVTVSGVAVRNEAGSVGIRFTRPVNRRLLVA